MGMKKNLVGTLSLLFVFLLVFSGCLFAEDVEKDITTEEVTAILDLAAAEMAKDAAGVIAKINASEHPFVNKDNPATR